MRKRAAILLALFLATTAQAHSTGRAGFTTRASGHYSVRGGKVHFVLPVQAVGAFLNSAPPKQDLSPHVAELVRPDYNPFASIHTYRRK